MMYRLALDIGATQTKIGIMDEEGIPDGILLPFLCATSRSMISHRPESSSGSRPSRSWFFFLSLPGRGSG